MPEGTKDSAGGPWEFVGLLPLFDPPRHDSAETIRRALDLGVSVKMITGKGTGKKNRKNHNVEQIASHFSSELGTGSLDCFVKCKK